MRKSELLSDWLTSSGRFSARDMSRRSTVDCFDRALINPVGTPLVEKTGSQLSFARRSIPRFS